MLVMLNYSLFIVLLLCCDGDAQSTLFINGKINATVCKGLNVTVSCGLDGVDAEEVPDLRIITRNNNGNVIRNETYFGEDITSNMFSNLHWVPTDITTGTNDSVNSTLLVSPVDGFYPQSSFQCNSSRSESTIGILTVIDPPLSIESIMVVEKCSEDLTVSWAPISEMCGPATYDIVLSSASDESVFWTAGNTTYMFTRLIPGAAYNVTVTLNFDRSTRSHLHVILPTVLDAVPTGVSMLRTTSVDARIISVSWDGATSSFCGNVITHYTVVLTSDEDCKRNDAVNVTIRRHTFYNLNINTTYNISVIAANRAGEGMGTEISVVTRLTTTGLDDGNELSTGAARAVAISVAVTFFVTFCITATAVAFIAYMCCKKPAAGRRHSILNQLPSLRVSVSNPMQIASMSYDNQALANDEQDDGDILHESTRLNDSTSHDSQTNYEQTEHFENNGDVLQRSYRKQ